jgi:hypothetical protein
MDHTDPMKLLRDAIRAFQAEGKMAAPLSDPAYGLSHSGSRVGNGRQRPDDG